MIIIFGTKSRIIHEDEGFFVCPECDVLRPYKLQSYQAWFTLFFIPIFPVGDKKNRHVECQHCKTSYYPRILEKNTFNVSGEMLNVENVLQT